MGDRLYERVWALVNKKDADVKKDADPAGGDAA